MRGISHIDETKYRIPWIVGNTQDFRYFQNFWRLSRD